MPSSQPPPDDALLRELAQIVGRDQLLTESSELAVYECDGLTHLRHTPRAVVLPKTTEEVAEIAKTCHRRQVPFVARGAGTGLSGGALATAQGIIIHLSRMSDVLEVNREDRYAVVQVGLVNLHLSQKVAHRDLHFAPDPSSQVACTIGGNVAENSGGPHCLKHGNTTRHVLALKVVLPNCLLYTSPSPRDS